MTFKLVRASRRRCADTVIHAASQPSQPQADCVPFTVVRAAQFHEFVAFMLSRLTRAPLLPLPGLPLQPVDVHAAAARRFTPLTRPDLGGVGRTWAQWLAQEATRPTPYAG
ncbi:hypothetical protein ACFQDE_08050 [Deinococcus caeni]|uniref:RmlD-like substrate binding domain-containing protein n=1 Tax=Deinococcus caeni TaxID=569127 RepID=A0ABP9UHI2_9DEIO